MKLSNSKSGFSYSRDFPGRFVTFYRFLFAMKKWLRWIRVQRATTKLLGFQYRAATEAIEIDLTYLCNLRCSNCNRSSAQAPDAIHIGLDVVRQFVDESLLARRYWSRIRLLGGEPTLHPDFMAILAELERYRVEYPDASIQLVTNGYGPKVKRILQRLPTSIYVENSSKSSDVQPGFGPFNLAPIDSAAYSWADYRNGCAVASTCGLGLTPQGYYPCAIAGGIDRVLGLKRGRNQLPPPNDEMRDLMDAACRLCGRFRDGHYVPEKLRAPLLKQETSPSWQKIYEEWRSRGGTAIHLSEVE
jgi:sulfatase maturation enzyme AslB (radical SAM superfamily)